MPMHGFSPVQTRTGPADQYIRSACTPPSYLTRSQRGIALLESVVAIALAALKVALALPLVTGTPKRRALEGIASELAVDLRYARTEAVARNATVSISFDGDLAISCYVLHTGPRAGCRCLAGVAGPAGSPAACDAGADEIKTVRLPASGGVEVRSNVPAMSFSAVNGSVTPAGTIAVSGPQGMEVHHVVSAAGRVRSCIRPDVSGNGPSSTGTAVRPEAVLRRGHMTMSFERRQRRAVRGFTLTELLVAMVLAVIMASLAYPAYQGQLHRSRRTEAIGALLALQQAQEKWRGAHAAYATLAELNGSGTVPAGQYVGYGATHYTIDVADNPARFIHADGLCQGRPGTRPDLPGDEAERARWLDHHVFGQRFVDGQLRFHQSPLLEPVSRTNARSSARGLTLVELLIGMGIGLFLLAGATQMFANQVNGSRRLLLALRNQQDLQSAVDLLVRTLRRNGYADADPGWSGDPRWRLSAGSMQMKIGKGDWQSLTDADTMRVTRFDIVEASVIQSFGSVCTPACVAQDGSCPAVTTRSYDIAIDARSVADPGLTSRVRTTVRSRNDEVTGACP